MRRRGSLDAKYVYGFWRPVTAIPTTGGHSDLTTDAAWLPLTSRPHPEYPAGHGCITGSVWTLMSGYFGTTRVHFVVDSMAFRDGLHTRRSRIRAISWAKSSGRGFIRLFTTVVPCRAGVIASLVVSLVVFCLSGCFSLLPPRGPYIVRVAAQRPHTWAFAETTG
jgi:hypothetical protein